MEEVFRTKAEEREHLTKIIQEWNASRLDMFALTEPNEDLEFHGVMRFYFQESGKIVTKCIRVSSRSSVGDLLDTLIEKFNPDMKMLSRPNYELYETHPNGEARKVDKTERPLLVQLGWHKDDREGRFLLKSANAKFHATKFFESHKDEGQLKRRLSRREKKEIKKKKKEEAAKANDPKSTDDTAIAEKLYNELPETSLTRSISNPEAVMKRRRQQKLERRLKEFESKDGRHTGGMIKIFAESLKPEIPYKTILASNRDTTEKIVKEALEKFMMEKEDPDDYCLVMAVIPTGETVGGKNVSKERVVRDDDCPLGIQSSWPPTRGYLTFHLRKRYSIPGLKKEKKSSQSKLSESVKGSEQLPEPKVVEESLLPYFLELSPSGEDVLQRPKIYRIRSNVTIMGSGSKVDLGEQNIQLTSPVVLPKHCVIANMEGAVTVTPSSADAFVSVNGQRILETTMLQHGFVVRFDANLVFSFVDPTAGVASKDKRLNETVSKGSGSGRSLPQAKEVSRPRSPQNAGPVPYSPPLAPHLKERILNEQRGSKVDDVNDIVVETTFGVDGAIESSPVRKGDRSPTVKTLAKSSVDVRQVEHEAEQRMIKQFQQSTPDLANVPNHDFIVPPRDEVDTLLPAMLEFLDHGQDAFFASVISEVNGAAVHFKLAPTYTLYLACRFLISPDFRPELGEIDHVQVVGEITRKIARIVHSTIQDNDRNAGGLAFWLANASELLHFMKQDFELTTVTQSAQNILAQSIQQGFRLLVHTMEDELELAMTAFLDPQENVDIHPRDLENILNDDLLERAESMDLLNWNTDERTFRVKDPMSADGRLVGGDEWISPAARIRSHGHPIMADVLYILSSAMSLLRRCRVNAALTIQLFSQLFHFINMWLFNKLVVEPELGLCTRMWGHRLLKRIGYVEAWAERQGLELAADCHLCRVIQAAQLLEAPKFSADDIASISSTCFKLNSLQLTALLREYRPERGEPMIPYDLVDNVAAVAENTADEITRKDGREVQLEEENELQLPFLLPEDGYFCDIIRGVPGGLQDFLEPLIQTGLCNLIIQPSAPGHWTVYQESFGDGSGKPRMSPVLDQYFEEPEVATIIINKGNGGLGLSIVAAKGPASEHLGIYIKAVVKGGAADADGRLQAGDQLLSVNGNSLLGVSQEKAAEYMMKTGPIVTLEVAKEAAVFHGLAALLSQQTSVAGQGQVSKEPQEPSKLTGFDEDVQNASAMSGNAHVASDGSWVESKESEDEIRKKKELQRQKEYEQRLAAEERRREEIERRKAEEEEEQRRIDEEFRLQEEQRDNERESAEMQLRYDEERLAEEQRIAEELYYREEERRQEEQWQQWRLEEEYRVKEQQRIEERRRYEEQQEADEQRRIKEQKRANEQKILEERRIEEQRREDEHRKIEEQRREQKRLEEERKYEEEKRKNEEERQANERKIKEKIILEEQRKREEQKKAEMQRKREEEQRAEEQKILEEKEKKELEEKRKREEELRRIAEEKQIEADKRKAEEEQRREEERCQQQNKAYFEKLEQEEKLLLETQRFLEEESLKQEADSITLPLEEKRPTKSVGSNSDGRKIVVHHQTVPVTRTYGQPQETDLDAVPEMQESDELPAPEDVDELPPPPDDLLEPGDDENVELFETRLQEKIQAQLASEQKERAQLERDQRLLKFDGPAIGESYVDDAVGFVDSAALSNTNSKRFAYDDDDSDIDVEQEFQRRLEAEKRRREQEQEEKRLYIHDEIEFRRRQVEHEYRMETERKLQVILGDRGLHTSPSKDEGKESTDSAIDEQGKRLKDIHLNLKHQRDSMLNPSQNGQIEQDDWMKQQLLKRERQRKEQERLRVEQKEREEEERQRLKREVLQKREQEVKIMREYNKQKDEVERRWSQSEPGVTHITNSGRANNMDVVKHQRSQAREEYYPPPASGQRVSENVVKEEFKNKAIADYERRRETLDAEIENFELEFNNMMRSTSPAPPQHPKVSATVRIPPAVSAKPTIVRPPAVVKEDVDDEPPPPRPPPPKAIETLSPVVRSPLPYSPNHQETNRFKFEGHVADTYSHDSNAQEKTGLGYAASRTSVDGSLQRTSPYTSEQSSGSYTTNSYRGNVKNVFPIPEHLSFKDRMKMFSQNQPHTDRSKFSKLQRDFME